MWRLIPSSIVPPEGQMESDRRLFKAFQPGDQPVLRFFTFHKPTLTLGRLEANRVDLTQLPFPYEIRPTGGWTVLHGEGDLCYSVTAPVNDPLVGGDLLGSYHKISGILAEGLRSLGAPVELSPEKPKSANPAHCFAAPSTWEILLNGKKVAGGAQAREGNVFHQQGVLLLKVSSQWREAFPVSSLEGMAGLNDAGLSLTRSSLEEALVGAFRARGVEFEKVLTLPVPSLKL
jgi:lipoyl(octanoyl) transferase